MTTTTKKAYGIEIAAKTIQSNDALAAVQSATKLNGMRFSLEMPSEPSEVSKNLCDYTWVIYGPPKIGKSTLASKFGTKPFFIAAEESLKFLAVYRLPKKEDGALQSWSEFKAVCKAIMDAIQANQFPHDTIVIDTVDVIAKFCTDFVCQKFQMEHPSDGEYGKGWSLVTDEFKRVITKLTNLGKGVIFISHSKEKSVKTRQIEFTKIMPTLSGGAGSYLCGLVDVIAYIGYDATDKSKRKIYMRGSEYLESGQRKNRLPSELDFDDEGEVYSLLKKHFEESMIKESNNA